MWIQKMRNSSVEILTRKFKTIHVLRDSGQTHKFIQERVALQLALIVITTKEFKIFIKNIDSLTCKKKCLSYPLQL